MAPSVPPQWARQDTIECQKTNRPPRHKLPATQPGQCHSTHMTDCKMTIIFSLRTVLRSHNLCSPADHAVTEFGQRSSV